MVGGITKLDTLGSCYHFSEKVSITLLNKKQMWHQLLKVLTILPKNHCTTKQNKLAFKINSLF